MRFTRTFLPGAALLGLAIMLAACSQPAGTPESPSSTPTAPTEAPSPSSSPSVAPSPSVEPSPIEVVEHELPMLASLTADADVHTLPSADSPLLSGEAVSDLSIVEEIRLEAGDLVIASMGPVFADGQSWYEVRATDGGSDFYIEHGWVPGESLSPEGDVPAGQPQVVVIHGLGSGTAATADVPLTGTPVTVGFAATLMPDDDACELEVTLIRTDGTAVNVATESLTGPMAGQLAADELSSLFQEDAGRVTLQVRTDCSFAASITMPAV